MSLSKHNLPQKIYLNGADCFYLVLDKHARKHQSGGNTIRIYFALESSLTPAQLSDYLNASPLIHWFCNIKLVAGKFLQKPFWLYEDEGLVLKVNEHISQTEGAIPNAILTTELSLENNELLRADLIQFPSGKSGFLISWNHILMDGKGMGSLLQHLNHINNLDVKSLEKYFPKEAKEPNIYKYVRNMYRVKPFIQNSARTPVFSLQQPDNFTTNCSKSFSIDFTREQTLQIAENATAAGAKFGINMFLMANCAKCLWELDEEGRIPGDIWFPLPYNGRLRGKSDAVISNNILFHFYRLQGNKSKAVSEIIKDLNEQMQNQMRINMPASYNKLLDMMRYIPMRLYYFLVNYSQRGVFASFLYTLTGENLQHMKHIFGMPISDIRLFSPHTNPPGLTFCYYRFDNCLRLNLIYDRKTISDEKFDLFKSILLKNLLSPSGQ
jgi:NRPS condensation-like uncharacterized protein